MEFFDVFFQRSTSFSKSYPNNITCTDGGNGRCFFVVSDAPLRINLRGNSYVSVTYFQIRFPDWFVPVAARPADDKGLPSERGSAIEDSEAGFAVEYI